MQYIEDAARLDRYLKQEKILCLFETENLHFRLVRYQKGELLTSPFKPLHDFLFPVQGKIKIYGLREDGSSFSISLSERHCMLGDMEFARKDFPSFYSEAAGEVLCVSLPIEENRAALSRDCTFLNFLLRCISEKVWLATVVGHAAQSIEERVLTYLREIQPDHTLHGVNTGIMQLHCSRRQLQRVVKKLCEEGSLQKLRKGEYKLTEPPHTADSHQ